MRQRHAPDHPYGKGWARAKPYDLTNSSKVLATQPISLETVWAGC